MYWATGILGLILAVAPWIFGYSSDTPATWTSLIVGVVTIIVSIVEGAQADRERWEYWVAGILGLVAIIAPFAFGFSRYTSAMWSTVVLGILIAVLAGSRLGIGNWKKT